MGLRSGTILGRWVPRGGGSGPVSVQSWWCVGRWLWCPPVCGPVSVQSWWCAGTKLLIF